MLPKAEISKRVVFAFSSVCRSTEGVAKFFLIIPVHFVLVCTIGFISVIRLFFFGMLCASCVLCLGEIGTQRPARSPLRKMILAFDPASQSQFGNGFGFKSLERGYVVYTWHGSLTVLNTMRLCARRQ